MMKKAILLAMIAVCMLLLSGCVPLALNMRPADEWTQLPAPTAPLLEPATGDTQMGANRSVTLYVVSDEQQLVPVERVISASSEAETAAQAVKTLLSMEAPVGAVLPFPEGTRLLNLICSGNIAVVELSIEARNVSSEQQLLWMRSVIAATLTSLEDIEYVSVLIAGRDEGLLSLPSCAADHVQKDLSSAWAQLSAEKELLSSAENGATVERTAILYYPTRDGKYIAPAAHTVRITENDMITPLIQALISPSDALDPADDALNQCLRSPFPQGTQVLTAAPQIIETEDGERLVQLSFDANLVAMLEREGLSAWQLYASLTYTITGFVPDVDGLLISLGDGLLTRTERNGEEITFEKGRMNRQSYPDAVCSLRTAYMSSADGGLVRVLRALAQQSALSKRAMLGLLFDGPQSWEKDASRVMPDGVSIDDILGIRIAAGEAVVNLSSNFYRCCQSLTPQQERTLIYAMVNTLTEAKDVKAVRFQVEGETVDYLTDTIFLRGALMRNVGIIRNPAQ